MNNGYLNLFAAFPDPFAIARRRALLRLIAVFIGISALIAVTDLALNAYQLWNIWTLIFHRMTIWSAAPSYAVVFVFSEYTLLSFLFLLLHPPRFIVGISWLPWRRPRPVFGFVQALLAAITARDSAIAPAADVKLTLDTSQSEVSGASVAQVVKHVVHPAGDATTEAFNVTPFLFGIVGIGLGVWLTVGLPLLLQLHIPPDSVVEALHMPLLTWLSSHRFTFGTAQLGIALVFWGCFAIAWGLVSLRYTSIARRGFTVRLDANGIQAQFLGARDMLWRATWENVRGFARLRHTVANEEYLLYDGEQVLIWEDSSPGAGRLIESVRHYAPVPLVVASEFLMTASRGQDLANPQLQWHLLGFAEMVARYENDQPFWRELWGKQHPGKLAPRMPRGTLVSFVAGCIDWSDRQAILSAAKALLPYYPTLDAVRAGLRTRFLSRGYFWFNIATATLALIWIAVIISFMINLLNYRWY
jgi:hypothetical protein